MVVMSYERKEISALVNDQLTQIVCLQIVEEINAFLFNTHQLHFQNRFQINSYRLAQKERKGSFLGGIFRGFEVKIYDETTLS